MSRVFIVVAIRVEALLVDMHIILYSVMKSIGSPIFLFRSLALLYYVKERLINSIKILFAYLVNMQ